uniref:Uncharacterized protein n=1 Tax=Rhizophora mucronata TaxID=61149 RepID=A0A2P2NMQ3_RHIMU
MSMVHHMKLNQQVLIPKLQPRNLIICIKGIERTL